MNKTIEYYNNNAERFVTDTQNVSMSKIQQEFLSMIPSNGKILDLGCGSGRDSKVFLDAGYSVISMDGSRQMCESTQNLTGMPVICSTFQEYCPNEMFDGIWACASLLHLSLNDIEKVISKLSSNLVTNGCFYMSFKNGTFSGERNGRFFTDLNEESFKNLIAKIPELRPSVIKLSSDVRPGRETEQWLNCFCIKE